MIHGVICCRVSGAWGIHDMVSVFMCHRPAYVKTKMTFINHYRRHLRIFAMYVIGMSGERVYAFCKIIHQHPNHYNKLGCSYQFYGFTVGDQTGKLANQNDLPLCLISRCSVTRFPKSDANKHWQKCYEDHTCKVKLRNDNRLTFTSRIPSSTPGYTTFKHSAL